jgi:hypothetical protein
MGKQYRQGDVLLVQVEALPSEAGRQDKVSSDIVLAYGEVTGHAHVVSATAANLYNSSGEHFLEVNVATPLSHQEHASIVLEPGVYRVIRQREYTPQENRGVQD